MAGNYYNL